jgi:hypothetical protein
MSTTRISYRTSCRVGVSAIALGIMSLLLLGAGRGMAPDWSTRLAALDPVRPLDYFELGEEVADAARTVDDRALARKLFGLAGALDPSTFGRSAALAQASLADDDRQRRTLVALASLLDAGSSLATLSIQRSGIDAEHAVALSEAFSHLRRGQGPRATSVLRAPAANALLEQFGVRLTGGPDRFREDCRAFKSGLRPSYPAAQIVAMLEVEEAVLAAAVPPNEQRSTMWSTSLVETNGTPLLEVDVTKLDVALGVDPTRPYWRNGQWEAASSAAGAKRD